MGLTKLSDPIVVDDLTPAQLDEIHYLGLGTNPGGDVYESLIIHRLISDAVVDSLYTGDPLLAPDGVFMTVANEDLYADEISALIQSLTEMGLTKLSDPIVVDDLTPAQLDEIHYLGLGTNPGGDVYESLIIHRLISDSVISTVDVPDDAYMTAAQEDVKADEISALIASLTEMGLAKLSDPINVDDLTIVQLQNIHYLGLGTNPGGDVYESLIIHRLISDSVISTVDVPDDAYMTPAQEDVKADEISALIASLTEMGLTKLSDPINVDDLSVAQLQNIHYLGLGTDPVLDVYESLIIHRMISDSVISTVDVPDDAYMTPAQEDVKADEVSALIASLTEMGLTKLSDPINVDDLTLLQLQNIHYLGLGTDPVLDVYESLIIHRMISDSVISTVDVPDDAYMTPAQEDVKADEVSALIEALDTMGLSKLSDPIDVNGLSVATLKEIHYLGLGTNPVLDVYESLIIHRLVSDAVVDSLYAGNPASAPDGVFMTVANEDLYADEISALIASMEEMGIVSLGASLSFSNPSKDQLQELHYLGLAVDPGTDLYQSLIVHRLISDSVDSSLDVPDDAYMTVAQEDIKVDEISALIEAMTVMGITNLTAGLSISNPTVTQLQDLHYLGLEEDPSGDVYDSYIVHRLISDSVDSALDVPDDAYMTVAQEDIKVDEISALIEAMTVMGITNLTAGFSFTNPTTTQIQELNYLGLGVDPSGDVYDSYIVHRLLSDAVSAAITVPAGSYIAGRPEDIKAAEIDHLIATMGILGATDVTDIVAKITVPNLKALTNPQIEVLVEAISDGPNLIVYYMISDVVDPGNNLYPDLDPLSVDASDAPYVMSGITRVRLERASIAAALTLL
jgi:cyclophilin family peptidyl-prolyl cis-trans isomerase